MIEDIGYDLLSKTVAIILFHSGILCRIGNSIYKKLPKYTYYTKKINLDTSITNSWSYKHKTESIHRLFSALHRWPPIPICTKADMIKGNLRFQNIKYANLYS